MSNISKIEIIIYFQHKSSGQQQPRSGLFTVSVPPVITARPGKTWGEGGENVEEGPGQDDVVVAPNVQG